MAKPKTDNPDEKKVQTPAEQAYAYMQSVKDDVYNFEDSIYYKVPCSSIKLTAEMGGGIPPGAHRAVGITRGGKTSCLLDFMFHFLKVKGRRGLYAKCEGRLSPEVQARSGITFVTDPRLWEDGTCLILESNIYEAVFGQMGDLIRNNPTKTKYFFVIDSMDMMIRRADMAKGLDAAQQVAGGALITSTFLKQTSLALEKRGHIAFFISQIREEIRDKYDPGVPRQGRASGGHAIEHQGTWVLDFRPRYPSKDLIREGDTDEGKILGHFCKVKLLKTTNEKDEIEVRYPIKYGRVGATSVWIERELVDVLLAFAQLVKPEKGSWLTFAPEFIAEVKTETGVELPDKVQGREKAFELLEGEPKVTAYLFEKYRKMVETK